MNWEMLWSALGGIGQAVEALIVAFGVFLILRQLDQIKAENLVRKWKNVQDIIDLLPYDDVIVIVRVWESEASEWTTRLDKPSYIAAMSKLRHALWIAERALAEGYVNAELLSYRGVMSWFMILFYFYDDHSSAPKVKCNLPDVVEDYSSLKEKIDKRYQRVFEASRIVFSDME